MKAMTGVLMTAMVIGAYTPESSWITYPDSTIAFVKETASFWRDVAFDSVYGGYYSEIDRYGNRKSSIKSIVSTTRLAYVFSRAFMMTGDTVYLRYAEHALQFLYAHGWDSGSGGWLFTTDEVGNPRAWNDHWNPNTWKWGYVQHYALLGIGAYHEATRDTVSGAWITEGERVLDEKMRDVRPQYHGYFTDASFDWSGLRGKGFTPTVDGITTHAELSYLVNGNEARRDRLLAQAGTIVNRLVVNMHGQSTVFGFPEQYDNDWRVDMQSNECSVGHMLKTAWCLGRAYMVDSVSTFRQSAGALLDEVWSYDSGGLNSSWDHVFGGPFNIIDWQTGRRISNSKDHWTLEQGFTAGMINFYITGNERYLEMADQSADFFLNHFRDTAYGEVFDQVSPDGTQIRAGDKGTVHKAGYHAVEMAYYAYLYSNLLYHRNPVALYYHITAAATDRTVRLLPMAIQCGALELREIFRDGAVYTAFDKTGCTLYVPAGTGGTFRVVFVNNDPETTRPSFGARTGAPVPFQLEVGGSRQLVLRFAAAMTAPVTVRVITLDGTTIRAGATVATGARSLDISSYVTAAPAGTYLVDICVAGRRGRFRVALTR